MVTRLNEMRIIGLPVQFVVVVVASLALTIFFGGWAASASVEARSQQFAFSNSSSLSIQGNLAGEVIDGADNSHNPNAILTSHQLPDDQLDSQGWETAFLFACPLH